MADQNNLRIAREISQIQRSSDLSIAVACQESDIRYVRALIVGPPGTPYENGFFEFLVKFGNDYPLKAPLVEAKTTNRGRTRFNPNIYAGGKVCLSILGTWHGEKGEEWSSAQGLESILLSIQSLLSDNPYENEPGYENSRSDDDKKAQNSYCAKIRHETIRIAVIQKLENILHIGPDGAIIEKEVDVTNSADEGEDDDDDDDDDDKHAEHVRNSTQVEHKDEYFSRWEPFQDLQKRRFLWYYETYLSSIEQHTPKHSEGEKFKTMPFEHSSNSMDGQFQYGNLAKRLVRIKEVIASETDEWATEGLKAKERESSTAFNLQGQFDHCIDYLKRKKIENIDLNLHEGNPFVWIVTYFGKSDTNLEGGIFRIRVSLSCNFPEEQPRVKFETNIFHHRVSKDGVLCYFPTRTDEVKFHIESIVQSLEEVSPPYDPRTVVHPEATKLLWGGKDDKKKYGRLQRRSVQDSVENAM